jgi:hypothetical protein
VSNPRFYNSACRLRASNRTCKARCNFRLEYAPRTFWPASARFPCFLRPRRRRSSCRAAHRVPAFAPSRQPLPPAFSPAVGPAPAPVAPPSPRRPVSSAGRRRPGPRRPPGRGAGRRRRRRSGAAALPRRRVGVDERMGTVVPLLIAPSGASRPGVRAAPPGNRNRSPPPRSARPPALHQQRRPLRVGAVRALDGAGPVRGGRWDGGQFAGEVLSSY